MKKLIVISIIFLIYSCKQVPKSPTINLIIEVGQSYKFDMANGIYTVFFSNKPKVEIRFFLTEKEKQEITWQYYSCGIDDIKDDLEISDECNNMPKIYTTLLIQNSGGSVKFRIDEECNDFYFSNYRKAKKIKSFLVAFRKITNQKMEVKNAPKSDIMYL